MAPRFPGSPVTCCTMAGSHITSPAAPAVGDEDHAEGAGHVDETHTDEHAGRAERAVEGRQHPEQCRSWVRPTPTRPRAEQGRVACAHVADAEHLEGLIERRMPAAT